MSVDLDVKRKTKTKAKVERPKLHKVILLNDDYTPRHFVVRVLQAVFRIGEEHASRIMYTAHTRGACVVTVFPKDVAETKATEANDLAKDAGHPLQFTTEPEE
ncbi:MAG: ATP-dependent Clp protease adapter ClpS [Pseudomonadota bacterium]